MLYQARNLVELSQPFETIKAPFQSSLYEAMESQALQIINANDGSSIKLAYEPDESKLVIFTSVKVGSFIAMGFGKTMDDTEIVQWFSVSKDESDLATFYA